MAATVSWERLRELAAFRAEQGCAISFYVDLDPRVTPTAGDADAHVNSLLAAGEKTEESHKRELTHDQRQGLRRDLMRIREYFESEFSRDGARGLAIFAAGKDNFWRPLELADPVPDVIKVRRHFYLTPLVSLLGRGDGALVAVVGREQGQLFRLEQGRLEEVVDRTEEQPGRHDQGGWSQANYQRHIEKLVAEHLRGVAGELDRQVRQLGAPKIVLICSEETRAEFTEVLSKEARSAIVGATQAEAHATPADLLAVARPLLDKARAADEAAVLERWREEAGRNGRAATGWAATLEAASDGRVELLLFQEGVDRPAWQCPACGRAALEDGNCPLDGTRMEKRDEGLDLAVHQTLVHGGAVWAVEQHHDLEPVEGIGALLRY
jgi:peptide chain release factor subunit 1